MSAIAPTRPDHPAAGVLAPRHRAITLGAVALIAASAFESLAVTTAMPAVADRLDGLGLYALAFAPPIFPSGPSGCPISTPPYFPFSR